MLKPCGKVYDIDFDAFYEIIDEKYVGKEFDGDTIESVEYRLVNNDKIQIGFMNEDEDAIKLFENYKTEDKKREFCEFVGNLFDLKVSHVFTDSDNEILFMIVQTRD